MATGRRGKARMIVRNDGMPGGMCHTHASHAEAVISGENDGKWHVAAAASYYYIHMILPAPLGRFLIGLNTGGQKQWIMKKKNTG